MCIRDRCICVFFFPCLMSCFLCLSFYFAFSLIILLFCLSSLDKRVGERERPWENRKWQAVTKWDQCHGQRNICGCQQTAEHKSLGFTKCFLPHCKVAYPNLTKPEGPPAIMPSEVKLLCSIKKDSKTGRLCCTMTAKHTHYLVRTPHCSINSLFVSWNWLVYTFLHGRR